MFCHFFNKYSHNALTNNFLILQHPAEKGDFQKKNTEMHVDLHRNFSGLAYATDPDKVSKDMASLVACTRKNIFWLEDADFL